MEMYQCCTTLNGYFRPPTIPIIMVADQLPESKDKSNQSSSFMSELEDRDSPSLPVSKCLEIDKICRQFEAAWKHGDEPKSRGLSRRGDRIGTQGVATGTTGD